MSLYKIIKVQPTKYRNTGLGGVCLFVSFVVICLFVCFDLFCSPHMPWPSRKCYFTSLTQASDWKAQSEFTKGPIPVTEGT